MLSCARLSVAILLLLLGGSRLYAERDLKVLVLIIASDDKPIYRELQKIWKSYMHLDPEHVEAYFIKGNPNLEGLYEIEGDTLWSRTIECICPGILYKTGLSLGCFAPRLSEFDYVLRTNLSSFYVLPQLIKFLKTLPRRGCYCGALGESYGMTFASGAGFILSMDLVKLVIENQNELFEIPIFYDDLAFGIFFDRYKINPINAPRANFESLKEWQDQKDQISEEHFHIRVKCGDSYHRVQEDLPIHRELLKKYYQIVMDQ
jgi:hypothetical protein